MMTVTKLAPVCDMVTVAGFPRAANEGQPHCVTTFPISANVLFVMVAVFPLIKVSQVVKPRVTVGGDYDRGMNRLEPRLQLVHHRRGHHTELMSKLVKASVSTGG